MADTAPKVAEKERREAPESVETKARLLAERIRKSKHFIAFTGAGISTSAGIPDFRGPEGAWTLRAQGRQRVGKTTSTLQAIPTPTHMALVELQNRGLLKYLVSQNCDGLHRRSGMLPSTPIDELVQLRVWSTTDDLMIRVMKNLDIPIPVFILRRRLSIEFHTTGEGRHQITVCGVDVDGTPVTFLQSVKLAYNRRVARSEPFVINFRGDVEVGTQFELELEFMGHYAEPNLMVTYDYTGKMDEKVLHLLEYNPATGEWKISRLVEDAVADAQEGGAGDVRAHEDHSIIDLTSD
ncbi:NAD-dependent protein deacetylase SRT1 [Colletotrichum sp. SAR 10_65]|nr:NAD-dependent protein deacetylase SRT1 [Colletotrichum sp. SAR 10_65]